MYLLFALLMIYLECTCWNLEATPSTRCVIPGSIILVNCLNFTEENRIFPHNIQWFKILDAGGIEPITNSPTDRVRSDRHQLRFNGTIPSDDGLYCCKSHTNIIERGCSPTATFDLNIALSPKIIQNGTNQLGSIGDTVHLECMLLYLGKPAASTFKWQRFGKDILQGPIYSISQSSNSINLTISNVTTSDEGVYNCIVENSKHQADNKSIYLSVQSSNNPASDTVDCDSDTFYPITVGLYLKTTITATTTTIPSTTADCSLFQVKCILHKLYKFVHRICK